MDDLISRQAAIDAPFKKFDVNTGVTWIPLEHIEGLPSAQPEPLTVNFAREMDRETIEKLKEGLKNAPVLIMAVNDSAQPERKTGRWDRHYSRPNVYADLWWHCSVCGYKNDDQYANHYHHYCPNCGAKMEVEHE